MIPNRTRYHPVAALLFSLGILIGSLFWPPLGFAVPVIVLAALISNAFSPRWFCAKACPRAHILGGFLPRLSRYRPTPKLIYSNGLRKGVCGFMLFCSIGQTSRLWGAPDSLALFFTLVCAISLALAIPLGILYKPRSWCALCPVGTLQETLRRKP